MKQWLVIGSIGALIAALGLTSEDFVAQGRGGGAAAGRQGEAAVQTPLRPNGVPDFTGIWVQTRRRDENVPAALDKGSGNYTNVAQPNRQPGGLRARLRGSAACGSPETSPGKPQY